jgi:two-component system sensor histidine kinase RpfC
MNNLSTWLRTRLSNRPDSEHGQALVRLMIFVGVMAYLLLGAALGGVAQDVSQTALAMSSIGVTIGSVLFCWILWAPGKSNVRRIIGMVADYGLMSTAMALMGEPLAWLYVIMMWVTVGNGLR